MRAGQDGVGSRARRWRALPVALVVLVAACGGGAGATSPVDPSGQTSDAGPSLVATTTVLGDVAEQVVGDEGEVVTLLPPGADPHGFQPSAQQVEAMTDADLLVTNGANLEESLGDAIAEAEDAGVPVFTAIDHVEAREFGEDEGEHAGEDADAHEGEDGDAHEGDAAEVEGAHGHDEGATDPHFWLDPSQTAEAVRALGERLDEVTGADASGFRERAAEYARQLQDLDAQVHDSLATIPDNQRTLVTNHDSFGYFAARYDFEVVGTVIPSVSTGAEPSAQQLAELAETIQDEDVGAIFAETTQSDRLAETLAAEVGTDVEVVQLYTGSLGEEGSPGGTYSGMLETNAQWIADALTS